MTTKTSTQIRTKIDAAIAERDAINKHLKALRATGRRPRRPRPPPKLRHLAVRSSRPARPVPKRSPRS